MNKKTGISIAIAATTAIMGGVALYVMIPECQDAFIDKSHMTPTLPSTPNFKIIKPFSWRGKSYVAVCDGKGLGYGYRNGGGIFRAKTRSRFSETGQLVCPPSKPCPGVIPLDYDWPIRRMAICDNCEWMAFDGIQIGGSILIKLVDNGGPWPDTSTKRIIRSVYNDPGTATYSRVIDSERVQFFVSSGWEGGCDDGMPRPRPTLWRVGGDGNLENLQCLPERFAVNGGSMVGENLIYLVGDDRVVTAWIVFDDHLQMVDTMPFTARFYDGAGISIAGNLLATGSPRVQLWDITNPVDPVMLSERQNAHSVATLVETGGHAYLWSATLAGSDSALWCVDDPVDPRLLVDMVPTYDNQAFQAGCQCDDDLCIAAGQVALEVDLGCYECSSDSIFSDGFETGDTSRWSATEGVGYITLTGIVRGIDTSRFRVGEYVVIKRGSSGLPDSST